MSGRILQLQDASPKVTTINHFELNELAIFGFSKDPFCIRCVTRESYGDETSWDYATINYYANGDTAWVRRYNGPEDSVDYAYALAIDGSGNVYVTGLSWAVSPNPWTDYVTVK